MKAGDIARLVAAILICQAAGIVGSLFTFEAIPTWYAALQKPWFSPPNWLFGLVWITLYTLMGIALFLVWKKSRKAKDAKVAIAFFGVQLFLNALWSIIFFGFKAPAIAFIEIVFLWVAIALTIVLFYQISKKAAMLMLPYILWVSIASMLNYAIWMLN